MERSFTADSAPLRLGQGDVFRGEGVLTAAKGVLQSGVSCIGGYQGAPDVDLAAEIADPDGLSLNLVLSALAQGKPPLQSRAPIMFRRTRHA